MAHALVAVVTRHEPVTVVTRHPVQWSRFVSHFCDNICEQPRYPVFATSDMEEISDSSCAVVALPQFATEAIFNSLSRFVNTGATVVFVPSPAMITRYAEILNKKDVAVVGLQRVPFVARIIEYGKSVNITGCRTLHRIATSGSLDLEMFSNRLKFLFGGDVEKLSSMLALSFSNSNALLHPSRMVVLFKDWRNRIYVRNPLFYGEWTDESSKLYISADREMLAVMRHFPDINIDTDYESVLEHYGVSSASELTEKLRSIKSLNTLTSPMIKTGNQWVPDFSSRYFVEDVTYGTKTIQSFARAVQMPTPIIDYLVEEISSLMSFRS